MIHARSPRAGEALALVTALQGRFVEALSAASAEHGAPADFRTLTWLRDEGRHGGGNRRALAEETTLFNRGSVNVSQVHYDDLPDKRLGSATALSTIIHPQRPRAPSVHIHVSFTELRDGQGYWRMMADLNPALPDPGDTARFDRALSEAYGAHAEAAKREGERYFFIPALERHRGVSHFYLESFTSGDFAADAALARRVGEAAIDTYAAVFGDRCAGDISSGDRAAQRLYHTTYFFQVLTLDRGTTSGLLVHDQNDVGILGSLPARVDVDQLRGWRDRMPAPQEYLLDGLIAALDPMGGGGSTGVVEVSDAAKARLARAVRAHYQAHPEALSLQASADVVPPTVRNHGPR